MIANRPVGVSIPSGQRAMEDESRSVVKKVFAVSEMKTYCVHYTDESGSKHSTLCHISNDGADMYMHDNDERWASELKTVSPWLSEAIAAHLKCAVKASEKVPVNVLEKK